MAQAEDALSLPAPWDFEEDGLHGAADDDAVGLVDPEEFALSASGDGLEHRPMRLRSESPAPSLPLPPTPRLMQRPLTPVPKGIVVSGSNDCAREDADGLSPCTKDQEGVVQSVVKPLKSSPTFLVPGTPASKTPKWLRKGSEQWPGPILQGSDQLQTGSPSSPTLRINESKRDKHRNDRYTSPTPSLMSDDSSTTLASSTGSRGRTKRRRSSQTRTKRTRLGSLYICNHSQHAMGTYKPVPS
nr:hypothetical protein CFP56_60266 [Quercus suber]